MASDADAVAAGAVEADARRVAAFIPPTATIILIGDGTHGTAEHYTFRADLTLALAAGGGVDAVLIEADVPAASAINAFVRLHPPYDGADPAAALAASRTRFPVWMWSNDEMVTFMTRLRALNAPRAPASRVGVYGLDIYALFESAAAVVRHFEAAGEVAAARAARRALACFTAAGGDRARDGVSYAYALAAGAKPCADEAVAALVAAARRRGGGTPPVGPAGSPAAEAGLEALLHARAVASAETYYSAMVFGGGRGGDGDSTWNIRDAAFADAVSVVSKSVAAARTDPAPPPPRVVVWAHNSHCGNAKATSMFSLRREINVGSLLKDAHGDRVFAVGCLTHGGTVAAASSWGGRVRRRALRPAMAGSYEALLHAVSAASGRASFAVDLRAPTAAAAALAAPRLERAVGVQYRPRTERASHMFVAALAAQFDAVVFWDVTRAVTPVPVPAGWEDVLGYDEDSGEASD